MSDPRKAMGAVIYYTEEKMVCSTAVHEAGKQVDEETTSPDPFKR
jgi:hypothetical protein